MQNMQKTQKTQKMQNTQQQPQHHQPQNQQQFILSKQDINKTKTTSTLVGVVIGMVIGLVLGIFVGISEQHRISEPVISEKFQDKPNFSNEILNNFEQKCLMHALWHEARSEPMAGINAVKEVIYNRVYSSKFPDTICAVVHQPKQFSFANQAYTRLEQQQIDSMLPADRKAYELIKTVVKQPYSLFLGKDVLWYTTTKIKPVWAKQMQTRAIIGSHRFYY